MKINKFFIIFSLFFTFSCGKTDFDPNNFPDAGGDTIESICGDGIVDSNEECDNGEQNSDAPGALCRTDCTNAGCGDGIVDPNEECDNGEQNANTSGASCRADCTNAGCGDGIVDPDEECDLGEQNSDEPDAICRTDCIAQGCGDGIVDSDEECDKGALNSDESGADCRTDCQPARCGDGIIDLNLNEECDDGNDNNADSCKNDCTSSKCGDGVIELGVEVCDDGNNIDDIACSSDCLESCGDGILDSGRGEQCDSELSDLSPNACRTNCQYAHCDDDVWDANQLCFTMPVALSISGIAKDAVSADFDGDGLPELVLVSDDSIKLFSNNAGNFTQIWEKHGVYDPSSPIIADVNNDSFLDIVLVESHYRRIVVFINNGSNPIDFSTPVRISTGSGYPSQIVAIDFSGDGVKDLVAIVPYSNKMVLMQNQGDGTTYSNTDVPTCNRPISITKGDLDSDNIEDVLVTCYISNFLAIYPNNGSGFNTPTYLNAEEHPLMSRITDFNKDGKNDVVVLKEMTVPNTPEISVFLYNSQFNEFQQGSSISSLPANSSFVVVEDSNNDSFDDMLISHYNGFDIYTKDASFIVSLSKSIDFTINNVNILWTDLDGDNQADLIIPSYSEGLFYIYYSSEHYPEPYKYENSIFQLAINTEFSDMSGNNINDIAMLSYNKLFILFTDGYFHINSINQYDISNAQNLVVSNFRNSSNDIVVLDSLGNAYVYQNDGNGNLTLNSTLATGGTEPIQTVSHINLNADNFEDAAILYSDLSQIVTIMGSGSGAVLGSTINVGSNPQMLATDDLNNDGLSDFIVVDGDGNSILFVDSATGSVVVVDNLQTSNPSSIVLFDVTEDSIPELIASYSDGTIDVYTVDTTSGLVLLQSLNVGCSISSLYTGELDNNGYVDLGFFCFSNNQLGMLTSNSGSLSSIGYLRGLPFPVSFCKAGDFNNNAIQDIACFNNDTSVSLYQNKP